MGRYQSRDAWDPTTMQSDEKAGGPSPAAERHSDDFELGNLAVSDSRPSRSVKRTSWLAWVLLLFALSAAGAFVVLVHWPLVHTAKEQASKLAQARDENAKLSSRVVELDRERTELEAAAASLKSTVEQKDEALAELTKTQEELAQKLQAEIQKGDVLIKQREGELVVDLVDQIVFDSGEAEINDQGKAVLRKVGETFLNVPDKVIQVGGHTDNVPISPKLIDKFPSNWELSAERAINVVRFLQDEVKIPGQRLMAAGFAEFRPTASNKTSQGRHRNRRIEVVLLPLAKGPKH
jgi:chemotaxis protein MotB